MVDPRQAVPIAAFYRAMYLETAEQLRARGTTVPLRDRLTGVSSTGFTKFYQKFVPNYANIVAPLSAVLRKDVEWTWGSTQQKAIDTVIQKLVHSTTLAYPDVGRPFHVYTDASDTAIKAALSLKDDKGKNAPGSLQEQKAQRRKMQLPSTRKGNASPRGRLKALARLPLGRPSQNLH